MFRNILVPIDLADLAVARPALEKAIKLAEASGAAVRLLNVHQLISAAYMDYVPETFDDEQRERATNELKAIADKLSFPPGRISIAVRSGGVYPEILDEATEWGADLIVIGSHRPSMSTYLMGSNAKTVARHAKCSVLIVRE